VQVQGIARGMLDALETDEQSRSRKAGALVERYREEFSALCAGRITLVNA
jgi:hypothetical protein